MLAALLLLTITCPQQPNAQQPDTQDAGPELQRELARLVDLPSARGRRLAAEALATKKTVSFAQ